jgi:hypothetical protein
MRLSSKIRSNEYRRYYEAAAAQEHYRLLTHLSNCINNEVLIDVGTLKGCSALALSANPTNHVYSFNIVNQLDLSEAPSNVNFIVDNVISGSYDKILLQSKVILLDTFHDGLFERKFYKHLKTLGYSGSLLLDDIYLNPAMKMFWDEISDPKEDLSHLGHITGTGIVYFEVTA